MKRMTKALIFLTAISLVFVTLSAEKRSVSRQESLVFQADRDSGWQGATENRSSDRDTTTTFFDDMESGASGWTYETGWALTEESSSSPTHSFNIDDDNYATTSSLITPVVSLPEINEDENESIHFSFDLWCNFPDFDGSGDNMLEDYYKVDVADMSSTPWHTSNFNAFEGNSWWCGDELLNGYSNGWLQFLDSPEISVPSSGNTTLTFKLQYAIEIYEGPPQTSGGCLIDGWDAANVRISTDGGSTWETMMGSPSYTSGSCYGWFYNGESCSTPGWGGYGSGWEDASFDLDSYAGESVILRFAFGSDPAWATPDEPGLIGFFLDDISVDNSDSGNLMYDNADDQVVMAASGLAWTDIFYDYGDIDRPGGAGWDTYDPGDPFNGNAQLDLSDFAGNDIRLRWRAIIDGDDDGGNGDGLFIDDVWIWKKTFTEELPVPENLTAVASDALVSLSWDPAGAGGEGGEIAYDNDDGSGGYFTNGIYSTGGLFWAGEYFTAPFGAVVESARIYGYESNTGTETTVYGFDALGGVIEDTPLFSKAISLTAGTWNDIDLTADGWEFEGDFVIAFDAGTFDDGTIMYSPLDETAIPSSHSYVSFGSWSTWQSVAEANGLPDGEWGIRAVVGGSEEEEVVYNIYRHSEGGDYTEPLWYGEAWPDLTFDDPFVANGNTYYYVVTAIYNYSTPEEVESDFSNEVSAMPEAATIYEMAYDDGTAESSVTPLGDGGFYAVHFVPEEPVTLVSMKYYATGEGGLTWVYIWADDGEGGMPGSQIGTTLLFSSVIVGWNEKDVSSADLVISEGGFYAGWGETSLSPQLGLDTDSPDDASYYQIPGEAWASIADLGYSGDLMIRAKVDAAVSVDPTDNAQLPMEFALKQNYPNPFNPVTFIPFDLPSEQHVMLELYDVTGRLVQTLVNEILPAGRFSYHLDASDLATGVYIYRIETEKYSSAKKLILVK